MDGPEDGPEGTTLLEDVRGWRDGPAGTCFPQQVAKVARERTPLTDVVSAERTCVEVPIL